MDDPNKTMPPRRREIFDPPAERTMPGKRDRKLDGRFDVGDLILGRYKVLSELGQGGMGVVYKCFDETGGIEVALKVMPPELSHNTLEMEDIRDNFQLVAKLVHQNIAISKQLERDNSNGNYYLIMECVEGENLRQWIKQKRRENALTLETVLPVVRQVAEALDYAHEQKIIHRDIKPGNIMIDSAGHVKVLDFGLAAQIHTSMTRISMAYHGTSGTGPYMAPEQWEGRVQGAAADQYALGVMTYEMLAGHLPFESTEAAVLREAVLKSRAVSVEGLPKYVQTALDRVLSKDPSERFDSCSDFTAALARIKVGEIKRKSSKGSWIAGLLLILTAGTGIVFGFFSIQERELLTKAQRQTEERQREEQKTESLYRKGTECYGRKDYSQAAVYFRKAAERGNARAQHNLGDCYDNGKGVEKNHSEAVKWYCKAAEQGDAEAQCALGYCYVCGQGVEKNSSEAVKWYRKAAEQGSALAQYNLGVSYAIGEGVERNFSEAVKWFREAAEQGVARAQYFLGDLYNYGQGVEKNINKAVMWYRKAAEQGHAEAQRALGVSYARGEGIQRNFNEAVKWFRKAAEQGDAEAQYNLGHHYGLGQGVEQNSSEAIKWYRKAADQGHAPAQNFLGLCYGNGINVEKNFNEAVKWYRKAADQGHAPAQYFLGLHYENGRGVEKDINEAVKWYRKAADQGHAIATDKLKELGR